MLTLQVPTTSDYGAFLMLEGILDRVGHGVALSPSSRLRKKLNRSSCKKVSCKAEATTLEAGQRFAS